MTGRYQSYPEYNDSGFKWLGRVPCHWDVSRFKWQVERIDGGAWGLDPDGESDTVVLRSTEQTVDGWWSLTNPAKRKLSRHEKDSTLLEQDDLLMTKSSGSSLHIGKTSIVTKEITALQCGYSNFMQRIRIKGGYSPKLYWYVLNSELARNQFDSLSNSTTGLANLNATMITELVGTTPPKHEQLKIVDFLDHETSKIDTLIEKQQQLIKLLKEKRQAVISHAVTKGLNPDAPMKDSGVEWLGEVPEHWGLIPLKYLCGFSGGGTPSKENLEYWSGGNIPWVSPKDMKTFWLTDTQDKLTELAVEESSTNFVESEALLMVVRSGILQRTIPIAINRVRVTLNQDMKALRFNPLMNVEYAANYIIGYQDSLLLEWSKEGATVESIEHEYLSGSLFPVPPLDEQKGINLLIKERMKIFQNLEKHAIHGISLLKERRTALISAAVTGKIDVRNWKPPEQDKSNKEDAL